MMPGLSLVLLTTVVAFVLATLINFAVSRVWRHQAISWPRLATVVTLVTLVTLLCWVLVALIALVAFSLKALGFTE